MQIDNQALSATFQNAVLSLPNLIAAVVIFVVMLFVAGLASKAVQRASQRRGLPAESTLLLSRATRWSLVTVGIIWALDQINFNVTGFVAALGILGFTIGFALQDISKNFVAGILLLWQQPFNIDDVISVAGYTGKITDVSIRATEMRTFDGLQVLIPNAEVYTNPITNYTKAPLRRIELRIGVSYATDLDTATRVALAAVRSLPAVLDDEENMAPTVVFDNFGESSVDFSLFYWINTSAVQFPVAQDQGVKAVKAAFARENIDIPFPVRTMIMTPQT
ncbi:MAG: mechanosensitive ion channel [Anaerolineae bacterium]|nr:mechanosensitive ion channel [Anaerolineae bacterium]MCB0203763.1 mechanosensitive ion channel [Anaerolineae bacterium]MCB0255613.1 mechanosensitive ion channel [Anaerolineae bacterium]